MPSKYLNSSSVRKIGKEIIASDISMAASKIKPPVQVQSEGPGPSEQIRLTTGLHQWRLVKATVTALMGTRHPMSIIH